MQMTKSPVNIFHTDKEPATVFQQRVVFDKQNLKIVQPSFTTIHDGSGESAHLCQPFVA